MTSREHHANQGGPTRPDMPRKSNMIEHVKSAECALYWGRKWTAILRDGELLAFISCSFFRHVGSSASLQSNINRTLMAKNGPHRGGRPRKLYFPWERWEGKVFYGGQWRTPASIERIRARVREQYRERRRG